MTNVQKFVGIAIAMLYVYVVDKAVSVFYNEEALRDINCYKNSRRSGGIIYRPANSYDEECGKRKSEARDKIRNSKFITMTLAGLAAIAVGFLAKHPAFKSSAGLGGLFCIFWATWLNWNNFNDVVRLAMTASTMVILSLMLLSS